MNFETWVKISIAFMVCLLFVFACFLADATHPMNMEITPSEYDNVMQKPYMIEYIKKHGLMKDGILTRREINSIPLPNPSKQTLLEMSRSN